MSRRAVSTDEAPKAIGPYSQAIAVETRRMVFLSGQIALDPRTGQMIEGDVVRQTEQVMANLKAVLAAEKLDFDHVVRTTIFVANMADFGKINEVYGRYFPSSPPARATVQAAALPRGALVEIDAIAAVSEP